MKINTHFDYRTKTLKVDFESESFSDQELEDAKRDLIEAGASENDLNQEIDEAIFEDSYLDECENCSNSEEIYGTDEEVNEDNFYLPEESEYVSNEEVDFEESDLLEVDAAGLWENIRNKKMREGKNYKPAKPGDKDRPAPEAWKKAKGAEYQGRKVTLNKPFRTSGGPKKFAVYTKNESGNVVIVRFGDPNMKIKKNIPARRKSFRARHNCENPGPKWKARYWACKSW
jgi:hypothetical protein